MKLNIKNKFIIINMLSLIPVIMVIYIITINSLYNSIIKKSIDYLKNESYNSQVYMINYLSKNPNLQPQVTMKNAAPFISAYISKNLKCRTQIYGVNHVLLGDSEDNNIGIDDDVITACVGSKCYKIKNINMKKYIFFSSPIYVNEESIGCIRYIYPLKEEMRIVKKLIFIMILLGIICIIFALVLSNILSKRVTNPIVILKEASQNVTKGKFSDIVDINSDDEVEDLANAFNIMSKSIESYIYELKSEKDKQQRFFNNATHQLKTPLTSIIGYSDLIMRLNEDKMTNECANYVNNEGKKLLNLIEEILDISRYNKTDIELYKKNCSIKKIIIDCVNTLKPRLNMYNIKINLDIYDKELYIDEKRTCDVILNIIDNCIKHSECNNIYFTMDLNENNVLHVIDDGQGIYEEDIHKVFEPFFKGRQSTSKSSGSGLGLNICKTIIEKQGGSIKLKSQKGVGTEIIIKF